MKLYQIKSLKGLSLLGYFFGIFYFFVCGPAIIAPSYNNVAAAWWLGLFFYILIYLPVAIISLIAIIVEYIIKSKNNSFNTNNISEIKLILFLIGIILFLSPTLIILYTLTINSL